MSLPSLGHCPPVNDVGSFPALFQRNPSTQPSPFPQSGPASAGSAHMFYTIADHDPRPSCLPDQPTGPNRHAVGIGENEARRPRPAICACVRRLAASLEEPRSRQCASWHESGCLGCVQPSASFPISVELGRGRADPSPEDIREILRPLVQQRFRRRTCRFRHLSALWSRAAACNERGIADGSAHKGQRWRSSQSTSTSETCSGWSVPRRWFASGTVTSSAPGMRSARIRPFAGGTSASSSPCTTSVGVVI